MSSKGYNITSISMMEGKWQYYEHNAIEETNNKINNTIEQNNNNINNNINKINDRVEYLQAVIASRSRLSSRVSSRATSSCQIAVRLQELH